VRIFVAGRVDLVFEECVEVAQVVASHFVLRGEYFSFGRLAISSRVTLFEIGRLKLFRDDGFA